MNRRKKRFDRKILLSALLAAVVSFSLIGAADKKIISAQTGTPAFGESHRFVNKDETVYASLHADGEISRVYVVNYLRPDSSALSGPVVDYGVYEEIRPLSEQVDVDRSGDEIRFGLSSMAKGFYYQGTLTQAQLPFLVNLTYRLDGEKLLPADLVGKSGLLQLDVSIRSNPDAAKYFRENYLAQIQMSIPVDRYTQILSPNASTFLSGKFLMVSYIVMPGRNADFTLTALVELAQTPQMTITSVPFSAKAFLGRDLPISSEDLVEISEGLNRLTDGTDRVLSGLHSLQSALHETQDAQSQILSAQNNFYEGLTVYQQQLTGISDHWIELSGSMEKLGTGGVSLNDGFESMQNGVSGLLEALTPLMAQLEEPQKQAMLMQMEQLHFSLASFAESLRQYTSAVASIGTSSSELSAGTDQLISSGDVLADSMLRINDGTDRLHKGFRTLAAESSALPEGLLKISEGQSVMKEQFNDALRMLEPIMADSSHREPVSFSDSRTGVNSVQIVLSITPLTMSDPIDPEPEKPEQLSFWQRFLELFTFFR